MYKNYISFIFDILKKHKFKQLFGLFMAIIYSVFVFCGPLISQYLIDEVIPSGSISKMRNAIIVFAFVFLMQPISLYIHNRIFTDISEEIASDIRQQVFESVVRQNIDFFHTNTKGEIHARLLNDTRIVSDFVADFFTIVIKNSLLVISIIAGMFYLNLIITLLICIILIFFIIFINFYSKKIRYLSNLRQSSYDELSTNINDTLENIIVIQVYHIINTITNKYIKKLYYNKAKNKDIRNKSNLYSAFLELGTILCVVLIYAVGFYLVIVEQDISLGNVIALALYFQALMSPLAQLQNSNINFQIIIPIIDRIREYLHPPASSEKIYLFISSKKNGIIIDNIRFSYGEQQVISDFSCYFNENDITCIIGASGVGKTTLALLLLGIIKPQSGKIIISGNESWYKKFNVAFVPQNVSLFHTTIYENITLYKEIDKCAVINICKRIGIYDEIQKFPNGFNTVITDQMNISGGQAQRILIARAIAQQAKLIIMDEPTAALDMENREKIVDIIKELQNSCTIIIITHDEYIRRISNKEINLDLMRR